MAFNRFAIACGLAVLAGHAGPAFAQYATTEPSAVEVTAARNCLCLERSVEDRRFELDIRNGIFEKSRADLDAIEREVEQRRPSVDVNDPNQVDAFRTLLARADAARTHYEQSAVPEQQQAVGRYNAVVDQLNAACKGRAFSTYAWEAARRDLVCPRN
ncbi:MAG: hypothetical protein IT562_05840 [Alphaproteobacteria bacterium]|nr:hypothetical protein [Alphaproteobacteria bacterium]